MSHRRRSVAVLLILSVVFSAGFFAFARDKKKLKSGKAAAAEMDESKRALHVLNRLAFGPRPGDVQRVQAMGVDNWVEQQLHPEKIDDGALQARLSPYRTLKMDTAEMVRNFPPPEVLKQVAEGRMAIPSDPRERAIYESAVERYRQRQEAKAANATDANNAGDDAGKMDPETRMDAQIKAHELFNMQPDQRMQAILKLPPDEMAAMARSMNPKEREQMVDGLSPKDRETLIAMVAPQRVVESELTQAKLLRAIYSERQLDEVMTDFWMNHFNVFIGKGPDRYMLTAYERDVIHPRVMGKFKDLLVATAKSPAMLFYLDNWLSTGPNSEFTTNAPRRNARRNEGFRRNGGFGGPFGRRRGPSIYRPQNPQPPNQQQAKGKRAGGLNENYAREIMELHTLGVNGGYTQKDVTELARVLTGWTIKEPQRGGEFNFNERRHEPGTKHVLGHEIKEHGEDEGMKVLDILAHHPSTAKFISRKLAMRFVSDDPPQSLIDRMAETFRKKDGDIREVLRTMFRSQEFWAPEAYRAKVKTPFEFVVSAVRATNAEVGNPEVLNQALQRQGMPLYGMQPPTGYSMKADAWVNSAALISRMNFALGLAAGKLNGIRWEPQAVLRETPLPGDATGAVALAEAAFLGGDLSPTTHESVLKQAQDPQVTQNRMQAQTAAPNVPLIAGLILGSPEFQRR